MPKIVVKIGGVFNDVYIINSELTDIWKRITCENYYSGGAFKINIIEEFSKLKLFKTNMPLSKSFISKERSILI